MADQNIPYGLRESALTPYTNDSATTLSTTAAYPIAREFTFGEAEDFEELRGDDKAWALRGKGASVEWEMENGGVSLGSYKTMAGGTIVTSGVTPNTVTKYTKKVTDSRPYFQSEGRAVNDNGGDFHVKLYRCRASDKLEGTLSDGAFWLTGAGGQALPSLVSGSIDALYDFVSNETPTPIVTP